MDPTTLTYREAVRDTDVAAVKQMVADTGFFKPEEVEVAAELVETRLRQGEESGYYFWIADDGGEMAGYACFGPAPMTKGSYDLYWIVVARKHQGYGLGKELLHKTETSVAGMGGRRIYVETSSQELYAPTRGFYFASGYSESVIIPDYYDIGDSKLIYQKNL